MKPGLFTGSLLALTFAMAIMAFSRTSFAQGKTVVIINLVENQTRGAILAKQLRQLLEQRSGVEPLPTGNVSRALEDELPSESPAERGIVAAKKALARAIDDMARFAYEDALKELKVGEDQLLPHLHLPMSLPLLAKLTLRTGLVHLGQRSRALARDAFTSVHFLMPELVLDPARYPPDIIEFYDKSTPDPASKGTVIVSGSFDQLDVLVDGRPQGKSPLELEVAAGVHFITLAGPGYESATDRVNVLAGAVEQVRLDVRALSSEQHAAQIRRDSLRRGLSPEQIAGIAKTITGLSNSQSAVILSTSPNGATVARTWGGDRRGKWRKLPQHMNQLLADLHQDLDLGQRPPAPATPPPPWYRQTWGVAAIGGGVAATIFGVVAWSVFSSSPGMRTNEGICFPPDC